MWRMKRLAGALLLAVLLCSEVRSQDATDAPAADPPADGSAATDAPAPPDAADPVVTLAAGSATPPAAESAAPAGDGQPPGTAAPATAAASAGGEDGAAPDGLVEMPARWECVTREEPLRLTFHMLPSPTADCEETKGVLAGVPFKVKCQANPESVCPVELSQDENSLAVSSPHFDMNKFEELRNILKSKALKKSSDSSGSPGSSSGSSVFVGILVSGLLAAVGLTVGYFKCQRKSDGKAARLAEEAHPVDQQNQGNTLVSVAPLNPPPETEEKPNINGETPDAVKTETPPTNGHSAAKAADTEL